MKCPRTAALFIRGLSATLLVISLFLILLIVLITILFLALCLFIDLLPCPWKKMDFGLSLWMLSFIMETGKSFLVGHWKHLSLAIGMPAAIWFLSESACRSFVNDRSSAGATTYPSEPEYYSRGTTDIYANDTAACPRCGGSISWTGGELNCQVEREYCSHCLF